MHTSLSPGDIVFAHSDGLMGRAIRLGEWLRWRKGSHWNHVAIVSRVDETGTYVLQADLHGVDERDILTIGEYQHVPFSVDGEKVLEFVRAQYGDPYGLLSIVSIVFDILTPEWFPTLRRDNTWICSALIAEGLRYAGWLHNWGCIYTVTPSQLWDALPHS